MERPLSRRLTDRQIDILNTICDAIATRGFPPTVREIAQTVGLSSPSSAQYQLDLLSRLGFIQRNPHRSRTIEVTDKGYQLYSELNPPAQTSTHAASAAPENDVLALQLVQPEKEPSVLHAPDISPRIYEEISSDSVIAPLVGTIAAGAPITAEQHTEDTFTLPRQLTGSGELFILRVHGESMIDAAICDGDYVVIRQQSVAEQGEIVAAMIDGEATVKIFKRKDGHVWLIPCNENFAPILGDDAVILGKVVTVLRSL